jgi:lactoylglutathione lyase
MKINLNLTESGHVDLNVTDLERSERFYRKIFGLGVQLESSDNGDKYAFLTNGGRLILTLWEQSKRRLKKFRPGLHHLAFRGASWDDPRRSKKVLDWLGVHYRHDRTVSEAEGFMSSGIFFEDPDGISLEIYP